MIIGDIETTEKIEYEDLLKNYYEKMEIIEEQDKEIERLHSIIKEVREYIEKHIAMFKNGDMLVDMNIDELLEILDSDDTKM